MSRLRLGLALAGILAALMAVLTGERRVFWGAVALLTGSLIVRLLQSRSGDGGRRG